MNHTQRDGESGSPSLQCRIVPAEEERAAKVGALQRIVDLERELTCRRAMLACVGVDLQAADHELHLVARSRSTEVRDLTRRDSRLE